MCHARPVPLWQGARGLCQSLAEETSGVVGRCFWQKDRGDATIFVRVPQNLDYHVAHRGKGTQRLLYPVKLDPAAAQLDLPIQAALKYKGAIRLLAGQVTCQIDPALSTRAGVSHKGCCAAVGPVMVA
ncbi:hypothetical protein GALL_515010 [mine drainage metagenome]|uniref:Uncharacterized protein n=1 Tax=mine drainage metagenome TaxID=410659 RepID=A0A1J5P6U4_9ZZZZ